MNEALIDECVKGMAAKLGHLDKELARVRTGRASAALLDGIKVEYYGVPTPLNQVASISTPDPKSIVIAPFEKNMLSNIERAVQIADIGIQPTNDGNVVRLPIPPLSEERRKELAKSVRKIGEDVKVGIRKIRQDLNAKLKKMEKSKELSEDESKHLQKEVQSRTDDHVRIVDERVKLKESDVISL